MIHISDVHDTRIDAFRSLKDMRVDAWDTSCIAEGKKTVMAAISSGCPLTGLLAEQEYYDSFADVFVQAGIPHNQMFCAPRDVMTSLVGFSMHQGIIASVKAPPLIDVIDVHLPCLVLNGIADSENVGTIVRTAAAFGWKSLIVDERTSSPLLRRAVRVSMGTLFSMRIHRTEHLPSTLRELRVLHDVDIVAAETHESAVDIAAKEFRVKTALVVGAEGHGIADDVLRACSTIVRIPLHPSVPSLNVATATALSIYEYASQHGVR